MATADLDYASALEFKPESGQLLLRGKRMLLSDSESFGVLRKDLIDTLGFERAKGVLMRYGYACGASSGKSVLRQMGDLRQAYDAFAGHLVVALEGFAYSTYETKFDRTTQERYGTGVWRNSIEVEEHLKHYDQAHEPVCWFLSGYATGYASVIAPDEHLIYREVSCEAAGDDECRFICKPREVWGPEADEDVRCYELAAKGIASDGDGTVQVEREMAVRAMSASDQLMDLMLKGEDVEALANTLSYLMDAAVVVEDPATDTGMIFAPSPSQRREILRGGGMSLVGSVHVGSSASYRQAADFYNSQTHPFQLTDTVSGSLIYRICAPIIADDKHMGFLTILRFETQFTQSDYVTLESCVKAFGIKLLESRRIRDVELSMQGDFIESLVTQSYADEALVAQQAERMGIDLTAPNRVLVAEVTRMAERDENDATFGLLNSMVGSARICVKPICKSLVVRRGRSIVIIAQDESIDSSESFAHGLAERVLQHLKHFFPNNECTIGIGSLCRSAKDYKGSYDAALKAIELAKNAGKCGQAVSLRQFGAHALLYSALEPESMATFAAGLLKSLLEHDRDEGEEFVPTLREFLEAKGNVNKTAQNMHFSYSGLKYRLAKISDLVGVDLKDSSSFLSLSLALDILDLMGEDAILGAK